VTPAYAEREISLVPDVRARRADGSRPAHHLSRWARRHGAELSAHLTSRRQVETALASTGVPVTVLRAAMITGSGSALFAILRYLVQRPPVMITPTWVSTRCQPIAIENVLTYLVATFAVTDTTGQVLDIGGREVICYSDIMRIMAEEPGLPRRWIIPVPVFTPWLSSHWTQLIAPLSHRIARPLVEGMKNEVVCRDDRITRLIPQPLLDVREAIHAALSQVKAHLVDTRWPMAGPMPGDPDWSGGTVFRDIRHLSTAIPAWAVVRAVCRDGGDRGWHTRRLWTLRGWLDQRAGGPGSFTGVWCCRFTAWSFGRCLPRFSATPSPLPPLPGSRRRV